MSPPSAPRRVLLVTPAFHGYWRSIADALARRGHPVATCRYDERSPLGRVRHQVTHELPLRLGRDGTERAVSTSRALAALEAHRPDVVVVVKGDVLGDPFWDALDTRGLPRVLWLYDEVRRTAWTPERLGRVGPLATYSRQDVTDLAKQDVAAAYLPLAFDPYLTTIDPTRRSGEVVFVGARYPRRTALLTALAETGTDVRVFGRDWSHHPVDRLRTWGGKRPHLPAGRDLDRAETYQVMAAASAALNIHGDQDGFTMRTFEASGVGGVQVVDRPDVGDLYEPDREVVAFAGVAGLLAALERVAGDPAWTERMRTAARRRTLAEHTFDHRVGRLEELWETWG